VGIDVPVLLQKGEQSQLLCSFCRGDERSRGQDHSTSRRGTRGVVGRTTQRRAEAIPAGNSTWETVSHLKNTAS
jgi:hypothetical protein